MNANSPLRAATRFITDLITQHPEDTESHSRLLRELARISHVSEGNLIEIDDD